MASSQAKYNRRIYLDCNATCPVRPEAIEAVKNALAASGNPSSIHTEGRKARALIERCRRRLAEITDAGDAWIYFTSGATEANNWAIAAAGPNILVSAIEHPSLLDAADGAQKIPVNRRGIVDLEALAALIERHRPSLVSIMLANNETGVVQPIHEISDICARKGVPLHVDAVQTLGKIPISFDRIGCRSMSLSAHKLGGPAGVGALIVCKDYDQPILLRGGGQERRKRAGTENVPGIAGFDAALATIDFKQMAELQVLHEQFEPRISTRIPGSTIVATGEHRLPNTSCIILPGILAETALIALDLDGIAASSGAACSSGKIAPSHVLAAMQIDGQNQRSAIRISSGWMNNASDFDKLTDSLEKLYTRLRSKRSNPDSDLAVGATIPT